MKRTTVRRSFWIAFIAIMLASLLACALASCQSEPDDFDNAHSDALQRMRQHLNQVPLGQPKTWQEWREGEEKP